MISAIKRKSESDARLSFRLHPVPQEHMAFYCYILECCDGTYYTGYSTDPERRLTQHNRGMAAHYTRSRRPVRLVYVEELPDNRSALKRERAIKALSRSQKQALISKKGEMP